MTNHEATGSNDATGEPGPTFENHGGGTSALTLEGAPAEASAGGNAVVPAETEQGGESSKPLSKNQQKKLAKQQLRKERQEAKRQERKKTNEAAAEAARKAAEDARSRMSEDERAAADARARELHAKRHQLQEESLAVWAKASEASPRIVLDLGFEELMTVRELASLQQQIMYSYGLNRKASKPCRLTLTSCHGKVLENLERVSGFDKWRIDRHNAPYLDVFKEDRESLVYLTSDATDELAALDPAKVYIIGGIVDHNRHKSVTLNKAQAQGIPVARLPSALFPALTTSKVLTVNQVFEILLSFWATSNWATAIQGAIPERKKSARAAEQGAEEEPSEPKKQKTDE